MKAEPTHFLMFAGKTGTSSDFTGGSELLKIPDSLQGGQRVPRARPECRGLGRGAGGGFR